MTGGGTARRLAALLLAGGLAAPLAACDDAPAPPPHLNVPGGDPDRGRAALAAYACDACHVIPGLRSLRSWVGPPLENFAQRDYIAGRLPNRPATLIAWILDPPALAPETAMPAVGVTEADARDMAAYLYTLGAEGARPPQVVLDVPLARPEDLAAYRADQERLLGTYGWADPERQRARIPIDRAIELLAGQEGGDVP